VDHQTGSAHGQLRDDLLNGQLIETLFEAKVLIEGSIVFAFGRTTSGSLRGARCPSAACPRRR
jgi:hypothetical protein